MASKNVPAFKCTQSHAALRHNRSAARHPHPRLQSAWGLVRRPPALRVVPRAR